MQISARSLTIWTMNGLLKETLAIAVYCALRHVDDFDKAITASVNHNGDSDSTGAVTGNILGAYIGLDAIPEKYKRNLELHEIILKVAKELTEREKIWFWTNVNQELIKRGVAYGIF